jgi:uncharacterized membrane protein
MLIAALSLIGLFVAMYLWLYKLGIVGTLSCKIGGCEKVNTSPWAVLFGVPVAFWGVLYYVGLFTAALLSTTERFVDDRRAAVALVVLTGWGVLFSAYLTFLELAVIHAICQWCVVSAILVVLMFVMALMELKDRRVPPPAA